MAVYFGHSLLGEARKGRPYGDSITNPRARADGDDRLPAGRLRRARRHIRATPAPAAAASATGGAAAEAAVDLAACLQTSATTETCPGFILAAIAEAQPQCREFGGTLQATPGATLASLDVDGDGAREYLFDFSQVYGCSTAASLFSCGSLGCPTVLYRAQGGDWSAIGWLSDGDAPGLEVLPAPDGGFAALRGGCAGERPCDELRTFTWNGSAYELSRVEVRGHDVVPAPDGLWTLTEDVAVLATPTSDSEVLDRYPAGRDFVLLGRVEGTDYRYVSPCNACASGFVHAGVLKKFGGN